MKWLRRLFPFIRQDRVEARKHPLATAVWEPEDTPRPILKWNGPAVHRWTWVAPDEFKGKHCSLGDFMFLIGEEGVPIPVAGFAERDPSKLLREVDFAYSPADEQIVGPWIVTVEDDGEVCRCHDKDQAKLITSLLHDFWNEERG